MIACRTILVIALLTSAGCRSLRSPETPPADALIIMTYNIRFNEREPGRVAAMLRSANADVVVMQEATRYWHEQLPPRLGDLYDTVVFRPAPHGGGLMLLTRLPVRERAHLASPVGKHPAWLLEIDTAFGSVQALVVHLHPPLNDANRFTLSAWMRRGSDRLTEIEHFLGETDPSRPLLVLGDFNEHDAGPISRILEARGLTNALREFNHVTATWGVPAGFWLFSNSIDWISYNQHLHVYWCRRGDRAGSDHRPVRTAVGPAGGRT